MTPVEADTYVHGAAGYVHIPFCSAICPYCDFAVVAGQDHMASAYVDRLCAEIDASHAWRPLDAVYFGGGTPSHVDHDLLTTVLGAVDGKHGIKQQAEVSLEANPEDFAGDRARELRAIGFNRVSFGAQSFDETVLMSLGRRHRSSDITESVSAARRAGFENVSLDLIYGTPGETPSSWRSTLESAIGLQPDHVSCYALTVEPGTPLGKAVRNGAESPDPDVQADRYEHAQETLAAAGYVQYEVSNWARPGRECVYNLIVWAQGEYEAYGNGAHGHRDGRRYRNVRRLESYLDRARSPRSGVEVISGWDREIDRLFVGLRRVAGVRVGSGVEALLESSWGKRLVDAGVVAVEAGRLVVRNPLLTDEVHRAVLDLAQPEGWAEPAVADNVGAGL